MKKIYYLILFLFLTIPILNAQTVQSKQDVKNHFKNGNAPGAIHFGYLIDACYNYSVGKGLLYDNANNLLTAEVPLNLLKNSLTDTATILRQERNQQINILKNSLSSNETNLNGKILDLENRMRNEFSDTSSNIRIDVGNSLHILATSFQTGLNNLTNEMNNNKDLIRQSLNDSSEYLRLIISDKSSKLGNDIADLGKDVDEKFVQYDMLKTSELSDTAKSIRFDMEKQFQITNDDINTEVGQIDTKIKENYAEFIDSTVNQKATFNLKLLQLETALNDSTQVLRKHIANINSVLILKIEAGDQDVSNYIEKSKEELIKKIDSLAEIHNLDRKIHEDRMTLIEQNHSVLKDTVVKMNVKLDTLNYTEKNFTQTLKLKLDNIDEGATRSDNNFTDELKTKLEGVEQSANNYQLPLATQNKLGGVQLSSEFVLYSGKLYTTLNPDNIDREFAKDTTSGLWNSLMHKDDVWTRVRYKVENGSVDTDGNKLYDYGEWNQPYKFIYDDLEASYYEFNATDSINVILGIHEKNKKFLGKENTLLGHNAGYTLFKGGDRNIVIGKNAGSASENISDNIFIGNKAGESIGDPSKVAGITGDKSSERNVALGNKAMQGRNSTGKSVAVGFSALELGEQNSTVAIGYKVAADNSGTNNVIIGYEAGLSVPGSNNSNNIAIGNRTGYKNTYAKRNVFVGDSAAFNNESGENNIFIGHGSGKTNTGNKNLFIGNDIDFHGDNQLAIGNNGTVLISGDFISKSVLINKLSTNELKVTTSKSDSYSIANKEVINNSASFVGEGGVNTSGQITSSFANTKTSSNRAISAPNGTVNAKYLSADESIQIGINEAINNSAEFVGSGGVNTTGAITTSASVNASDLASKTANFTDKLTVAGIDIVKTTGSAIEERYAQKIHTHGVSEINTNSTNQFVSQTEKNNWNNKVDQVSGKQLSTNDFTSSYKSKLDGIATRANKYVHPANHSATIITQDDTHRFVTDSEKSTWNNKVDKVSGKQLSTNDFTSSYKSKIDGIASGANKYVHPSSHSASMITQDASHRFISDSERTTWNNKVNKVSGKALSSNDFTNAYKSKLDGIATGANKYVHPTSHSADMISTTASKQFVSQTDKDNWNAGQIPVGGIIMWNGTTVPDGWALCNGQTVNGKATPDLRGRFIVGSYPGKSGFSAGNSGGTVTNVGQTSTSGSHNHSGNTGGYKLNLSDLPEHRHNMAHTHKIPAKKGARYSATADESTPGGKGQGSRRTMRDARDYNFSTEAASTNYTGYTGRSSSNINAHKHTISTDGSHVHIVPYYVLAFIMRVQ